MKRSRGQLISGLDVGSSIVRMAVGQLGNEGIQLIGAAEAPSAGVQRGVVQSIEEAVSSVSACLERVERIVGAPLEHVWVGISGTHITTQESKGVVAVARANGEITQEDVERAIEAARTVATPLNHEILHVIPHGFSVDGQTGIKDPVGMTGVRLEVDTRIIQGLSSQIKNLTKAVYRTGLDINGLALSVLAAGEAVLTPRQKELGAAVVNIGSATTALAVYENGDLLHTAVIPLGSDRITSDIAIGLRIDIDIAERVKLACGRAIAKSVSKRDELNLAEVGAQGDERVSIKYIAEIIEARVEEMFDHVDRELKSIHKSGMLPCGVMCTGGGAKLPDLIELAKRRLRLPAAQGVAVEVPSITDRVNDCGYATAIGLVLWGKKIMEEMQGSGLSGFMGRFKSVDRTTEQVAKWFKSLLP